MAGKGFGLFPAFWLQNSLPDSDAERPVFVGQALSVCRRKVLSLPIASLLFGRHVRPGAVTGQNAASDGSVPQASLNMGATRPYAEAVVPFFPCRSDFFGFFGRSLVRSERETTGDRSFPPIVSFDFPVSDRPKGIVPGGYVGCLQKTGGAMVMPNEKADTSFRGIRFLEIVSDFSGPGRIVIRRNRRFRSRRDRTILPFATESRLSTS